MLTMVHKSLHTLDELLWQLLLRHMATVYILNQLCIRHEFGQPPAVGNGDQPVTGAMQYQHLHTDYMSQKLCEYEDQHSVRAVSL